MKKKQEKANILFSQSHTPTVDLNLSQFLNQYSPIRKIDDINRNCNQQLKLSKFKDQKEDADPQLEILLSKIKSESEKAKSKIERHNKTLYTSILTNQTITTSRQKNINIKAIQKQNINSGSRSRRNSIFGHKKSIFERNTSIHDKVVPIEVRLKTNVSSSKYPGLESIGHCSSDVPKYTSLQIEMPRVNVRQEPLGISFQGQEWFNRLGKFCR